MKIPRKIPLYKYSLKILLSILLVCQLQHSQEQTLEHQYTGKCGECQQVGPVNFVYLITNGNNQVSLYTLNHDLIKNINLSPGGSSYQSVIVTQTLFNNNNKYEISYLYHTNIMIFEVIDEDGNLLHRDSLVSWYQFRNTNQGVKLLTSDYSSIPNFLKVYSLPGQLYTVVSVPEEEQQETEVVAFPNPSGDQITISIQPGEFPKGGNLEIYNMNGDLIQKLGAGAGITKIILNASRFSAGTYLYRFISESHRSASGKFIIE
jgi:hypothetical protein